MAGPAAPLEDLWDDAHAVGLSETERLVLRSNLLGRDPRITNFGGGNTSAKIEAADPLTGEPVTVLWVKGSGGDLASLDASGFATLYLDKLLALEKRYRGLAHEDEMVGYLQHCVFGANPRAPSIDTPLHALLSFRHIDHVHPDSVVAIATARRSEALTNEVFGGEMGWLAWQRPGFDLGLRLRDLVAEQPGLRGVVLAGHGVFAWGETSRDCYRNTLEIVNRAEAWLARRTHVDVFGGLKVRGRLPRERRAIATRLLPLLRGRLSQEQRKIGHFDESDEVLEFVGSSELERLAARGTSCPDHFLRTKIRPLVLPADPEAASAGLDAALGAYQTGYEAYYARCRRGNSPPMRDPYPVILLMPGVGLFSFAGDKATARIAAEFYRNTIHVMRGASAVDEYCGLPEQEAFDIEYWPLEEAKLRRRPQPLPLAGQVGLITGAGGGIGSAIARRFLEDDACVVLVDIDASALETTAAELVETYGVDRVRRAVCDVTDEASVAEAFRTAALEFGGLDLVVSNAGIATAAPIEKTTLSLWRKSQDVLATGYFLVAREGARLLGAQGRGGAMVFVASKNGLVASAEASAYSAAKAAEIHLARVLALELAPKGIRVNVVNPDAVIRGSKIWTGRWRRERAAAHGIPEDEVEAHYRRRSLLGRDVLPEDVAEAVCFFASERSAKSTGNILNVDAGNAAAFPR
ncbi:MAG: bifunctional rhamnulose-1-phosphate aldolase/short-chain dehydrogenase [Myxococcota bacterium]